MSSCVLGCEAVFRGLLVVPLGRSLFGRMAAVEGCAKHLMKEMGVQDVFSAIEYYLLFLRQEVLEFFARLVEPAGYTVELLDKKDVAGSLKQHDLS